MPKTALRFEILAIVIPIMLLCACNNDKKVPDVSNIKIDLQTYRFDKDLAALDTNNIGNGLMKLNQKYPDFLNFYLDTLMGFDIRGNYVDTTQGIKQGLRVFLTYKDYRGLFDTVAKHFPDTKNIETELKKGFQFMKHYFPNYNVPHIEYLVAGLNKLGAFTDSTNIIGIDLDMFLGGDYPYYRSVGIPAFMNTHLVPAYVPVAVFSAVHQDSYPFLTDDKNLLDMIIQRGKEQYFLHCILPNTPDSVLFGFTQSQLNWCDKNERDIYNFFIHDDLLYSKDWQKILRYVNDGPNATGMPPESPGNIGSWMGWRIVEAYMGEHPQTTLPQLLALHTEPQDFLTQSRYKPK